MILRSGKETLCMEQVIVNPIYVSVKSNILVQKMIDQLKVWFSQNSFSKNPIVILTSEIQIVIISTQNTGRPPLKW